MFNAVFINVIYFTKIKTNRNFDTLPESDMVSFSLPDPNRTESNRPDPRSKVFFDHLKRVFLDLKYLVGEFILTLSKLIKSLSHLELLFLLCKVRHWFIIMTRTEIKYCVCNPTRTLITTTTKKKNFFITFLSIIAFPLYDRKTNYSLKNERILSYLIFL